AQADLFREKALSLNNEGEYDRRLRNRKVESQKLQRPIDNGPGIADDMGKASAKQGAFDSFAGIKSNAFRIFAQSHQCVPVVRVEPFVQEVEQDQWTADFDGKDRCHQYIGEHQKDHAAWDLQAEERNRSRQVPQDQREGKGGYQRVDDTHGQGQRHLRKTGDVLLNPLIGVVDWRVQILTAVISLLVEPATQQPLVQPDAPSNGEGLLYVEIEQ